MCNVYCQPLEDTFGIKSAKKEVTDTFPASDTVTSQFFYWSNLGFRGKLMIAVSICSVSLYKTCEDNGREKLKHHTPKL